MFIYRMQASFVTRPEHHALGARVNEVEDKVGTINQTISGLFTNKDAEQLKDKMSALAVQNATLLGEIPGLRENIKALAHQTGLLNQHALSQAGKPQ